MQEMAHLFPVSCHLFLWLLHHAQQQRLLGSLLGSLVFLCLHLLLPGLLLLLSQCSLLLSQQLQQGHHSLRHLHAAITSLIRFALQHGVSQFIVLPRPRGHLHSSMSQSLRHTHCFTSKGCCIQPLPPNCCNTVDAKTKIAKLKCS